MIEFILDIVRLVTTVKRVVLKMRKLLVY
jgi:hypothetical protein